MHAYIQNWQARESLIALYDMLFDCFILRLGFSEPEHIIGLLIITPWIIFLNIVICSLDLIKPALKTMHPETF